MLLYKDNGIKIWISIKEWYYKLSMNFVVFIKSGISARKISYQFIKLIIF